jgi:hypothetical protein
MVTFFIADPFDFSPTRKKDNTETVLHPARTCSARLDPPWSCGGKVPETGWGTRRRPAAPGGAVAEDARRVK